MTQNTQEKDMRAIADDLIYYAKVKGASYGITDVVVCMARSEQKKMDVENGSISQNIAGTSHEIYVTLFAGDRKMYFSKNTFDIDEIKATIDENMKVIHLVPEAPDDRLLEADKVFKGPKKDFDIFDDSYVSPEQISTYLKAVEAETLAQDRIKTTRGTSFEGVRKHYLLKQTNGVDTYKCFTHYSAGISAIAQDENGMQVASDTDGSTHFDRLKDPQKMGQKAAKNATSKLGASLPKTGQADIILSPGAASGFFNSVFNAIDGYKVFAGSTFLRDKIGKQIMSKGITIGDDPHVKGSVSSQVMDTAGIEAKKMVFVKDGVLQSFNSDLLESRKLGITPIGREDGAVNARVSPSKTSKKALMSDIENGIYIKGFQGGTVDVNTGVFSRQAYGLLIKDGKVTNQAVDGFIVSGNLKDMFMNVSVANDSPQHPKSRYSLAAPTSRINNVTIAGK